MMQPDAAAGNPVRRRRPRRQSIATSKPKLRLTGAVFPVRRTGFHLFPMTDRKHIGFVVPVEMAAALESETARHDRSVSATLRQMVRAQLAEKRNVPGHNRGPFKGCRGQPGR